jgi:hypothetical protein
MAFFDTLIVSWDIDLASFSLEILLNRKVVPRSVKRFEFIEKEVVSPSAQEPGLRAFLKDRSLSADATPEEIEFLKHLRFEDSRRPTALYYYRELQSLRDPLHFHQSSGAAVKVAHFRVAPKVGISVC